MPTINSREIIDTLIKNDGHYEDDPPASVIVEYTNAWGGKSFGITYMVWDDPNKYLISSEFVQNPKILWLNKDLTLFTCAFCGARLIAEKPPDSWIPSFWHIRAEGSGKEEEFGPVCPDCAGEYLRLGEDGEWEQIIPRP